MACKVTDKCIRCGACEAGCKNAAILEGKEIYNDRPQQVYGVSG